VDISHPRAGPRRLQSRVEVVLEHIKRRIADGALAPGAQLPTELALARELGVSRTSVREATKLLAASGVIDVRHGHGTFVSDGTQASVAQLLQFQLHLRDTTPQKLMELRLVFERACAELAAERRTEADLRAMRDCIERLRGLADLEPVDIDAVNTADMAFHRAVYRATDNELVATVAGLVLDMVSGWLHQANRAGDVMKTVELHETMLRMIQNRDSGGARECYGVEENMAHFRRMLEAHRRQGDDLATPAPSAPENGG
jgi:GntR family transcriptional repressor for pyruvate dehydrogenase complex